MNLDDLTIREAKKLAGLFCDTKSGIADSVIGEYVIVRSRNEGVNAGVVEQADETGVVLKNARRIWYHRPKDKSLSWYEGVAISGLSDDSKVSPVVYKKVIVEDYSITLCNPDAANSIREHKAHEQS